MTVVSKLLIAIAAVVVVAGIGLFSVFQPPKAAVAHVSILKDSSYKIRVPEGLQPKHVVVVLGVNNTVGWTNNDPGVVHTVTSDLPEFNSGFLDPGKTFTHTFKKPGTYTYHCELHLWVIGEIVAKEK